MLHSLYVQIALRTGVCWECTTVYTWLGPANVLAALSITVTVARRMFSSKWVSVAVGQGSRCLSQQMPSALVCYSVVSVVVHIPATMEY